ncbi:DUF3027 domain-containing protein [Sinomonas atrocyanea]|uniref:DUF3027 domain-containing protein n=1 Tax=Sinomonas atrocyanea TaxID=37927 RepID=UPI003D98271B
MADARRTAPKGLPTTADGVPIWRIGKPDAFLAAAVDAARAALADVARPEDIGEHVAAKSEGERVVTHLFESLLPGYRGWQWFVTVARTSRSKVVTVSEVGLVPSKDSVLAPEWVPWADRVRPEDRARADAEAAEAAPAPQEHDGGGSPEPVDSPQTDSPAPEAESGREAAEPTAQD